MRNKEKHSFIYIIEIIIAIIIIIDWIVYNDIIGTWMESDLDGE